VLFVVVGSWREAVHATRETTPKSEVAVFTQAFGLDLLHHVEELAGFECAAVVEIEHSEDGVDHDVWQIDLGSCIRSDFQALFGERTRTQEGLSGELHFIEVFQERVEFRKVFKSDEAIALVLFKILQTLSEIRA